MKPGFIMNGSRYYDTGCSYHDACLSCPFPECRYEGERGEGFQKEIAIRDRKIFSLRKNGVPVPELQRAFNLSKRSIARIIQKGGA